MLKQAVYVGKTGTGVADPGFNLLNNDIVSYEITFTNTGNETMTNVALTDSPTSNLTLVAAGTAGCHYPPTNTGYNGQLGPAFLPNSGPAFSTLVAAGPSTWATTTLAPGASIKVFMCGKAAGAAGDEVKNTAAVSYTVGTSNFNLTSTTVGTINTTKLTLTKTDNLNPTKYTTVGQVVTYTLTAKNTGTATLNNVTVTDSPALTGFSCTPASPVATLAANATVVCTGTHTITQADLDAGTFTDTGSAVSNETTAPDAPDTITAMQTPTLTLSKTDNLNPAKYTTVGQVVSYTLTATNTGNVTLHNVTVTDSPALSGYSCTPASPVASLAPGGTVVCTGTHAITQADLDAGSFTDTGTADSDETSPVMTPDTVTATQTPTLALTKTDNLNPAKYTTVGQVVSYTLTATNTGNVTLHNVTVTDSPALNGYSCTPVAGSALAPGGTMVCTGTHAITQATWTPARSRTRVRPTATRPRR